MCRPVDVMPEPSRTIALSRQRGSGGSYVGRIVAERLGLRYIDREMLRNAAEYLRPQSAEQQLETRASSWFTRLGEAFARGGPDCGYVPPSSDAVYEGELFDIEQRLLLDIMKDHAAVIVGRGAAQTLRGRPGVLAVLVHAPEPWRIARVQQVYGLADPRAAERMVHGSDRDRASFVEAIGGGEWTDARGYDLAVDTAALGFEPAVEIIVRAVRARTEMAIGQ